MLSSGEAAITLQEARVLLRFKSQFKLLFKKKKSIVAIATKVPHDIHIFPPEKKKTHFKATVIHQKEKKFSDRLTELLTCFLKDKKKKRRSKKFREFSLLFTK